MKSLTPITIVWFAVLLLLFVFAAPLNEGLFFFYPLLHWGVVLMGFVLLVLALIRARHGFRQCLPALLITVIGLGLFYTAGFRMGRLALFQIRKSHFEELLAEATRIGDVPSGSGYYEEGPPARFAFYWQRGILDNWAGVVHDPLGDVMRVNDSGGTENRRDRGHRNDVRLMFGGVMYRCERLQGNWYLCWFT